MVFGMQNAPVTFQQQINIALSRMTGCEALLDDVVVYSSSWSDHIEQIHDLFHHLSISNLINLAKCDFGKATVPYLGKIVGRDQVHPTDAKISVYLQFHCPCRQL